MEDKPYYIDKHKYIGVFNIPDGLVDITDPCYDHDVSCAFHDYKVMPGEYSCYIDVVNFPWTRTEDGKKKTANDYRITKLAIICDGYSVDIADREQWKFFGSVAVDAGMCGFYNHKPDFRDEGAWSDFWQNAKHYPYHKWLTCDIKPYGVTTSSGMGDGWYNVYKHEEDGEVVALKLVFD